MLPALSEYELLEFSWRNGRLPWEQINRTISTLCFIKNVALHLWSYVRKILMDFNNFYISGNGNKCPLQVSYLLIYFMCDVNMTSRSMSLSCWWAATAWVTRLGAVAVWWRSWPMANMLACLCSCQWWTLWTYLVTVSLLSLYLMNFMFHTMLAAVGNILRVHYKSMKCDVSFSQGSISTLFR